MLSRCSQCNVACLRSFPCLRSKPLTRASGARQELVEDGDDEPAVTEGAEDWRPMRGESEPTQDKTPQPRTDWSWYDPLLLQEEFISMNEHHRRESQWWTTIAVF